MRTLALWIEIGNHSAGIGELRRLSNGDCDQPARVEGAQVDVDVDGAAVRPCQRRSRGGVRGVARGAGRVGRGGCSGGR